MYKKTIWIVNEYNGPNEIRTRQTVLSQRLMEQGYDVYLFAGSSDNKGESNYIEDNRSYQYVESDGAKFYVIKTRNYRRSFERILVALQFQYKIWNLRKNFPKPDVIVSDFAGLFGNTFLRWKKKYGTKIIYDILDLWPEGFVDMGYIKKNSLIAKMLYRLEHKSYREADGIIFSMQGGRDYIVEKGWSMETGGDVDTSDIGYLDNGVDLETVDKQKNEYILDDPDLDSPDFKVVYLGSVSAFNGVDKIVETAKVLQERNENNIRIMIYGYGNQEKKIKELIQNYHLKNIALKGKLDKKYAMNLLTKSDLNIFTFREIDLIKYGVSPNKLFMYFASGKPVLSMIKPAYDLVEEKKAGISVDNDPEAVADAIIRFRKMDKQEYVEFCKNARETAEEYDYKKLVNVLIEKIEA